MFLKVFQFGEKKKLIFKAITNGKNISVTKDLSFYLQKEQTKQKAILLCDLPLYV